MPNSIHDLDRPDPARLPPTHIEREIAETRAPQKINRIYRSGWFFFRSGMPDGRTSYVDPTQCRATPNLTMEKMFSFSLKKVKRVFV